ncbi:1-acyl-sn-glycerol-3-phosphate acyltransferase [Acidiferrobacter thiooxydans]|uniref:1-acyl-sn-glycerol-3-phosphate acyltransferase n=2 Tax=Acidiferrobacter thiooxydans TaxID=163359 RepID=A0A368HL06_9GAMM|nr:1-acyl-sn-glycerol-3-phosphate acyltransferase [Acidiferrobacter thiooxydans]
MKIPGGAVTRLMGIIGHIALGGGIALVFPAGTLMRTPRGQRIVRWWHRRLLRILGLELRLYGIPAAAPALIVANHISWVEFAAVGAVIPGHFVAKSEIRSWPLIGWFAGQGGTIYIKRGDRGASTIVDAQMVAALRRQESIILFPEGTTSDGQTVQMFHPRLFAVAIEADVTVQPVALRYSDSANHACPAASFAGREKLIHHLWRLLRERGTLRVEVYFLAPEQSLGASSLMLATNARNAILQCIEPVTVQDVGARAAC